MRKDLNWCVYQCMKDGRYWTFWELQDVIKTKAGKFYGEPTISAAIRNLRKDECRNRFQLPSTGEVVEKKRISGGKGYQYKLITGVNNHAKAI